MVFYGLNGVSLDGSDEDAYDLVIAMASQWASGQLDYPAVAHRFAGWRGVAAQQLPFRLTELSEGLNMIKSAPPGRCVAKGAPCVTELH